jgi:hypothetical protein
MMETHISKRSLARTSLLCGLLLGCARDVSQSDRAGDTDENRDVDTAAVVDTAAEGGCIFTHSLVRSEVIPTVGTVTWSVVPNMAHDAKIEFGLDTDYGITAPARFQGTTYKTMLLGLKPQRTYHYRIVATIAATTCVSEDYTMKTGSLPTGIPTSTITTARPDAVESGFTISAFFSNGNRAFILDGDGEYVWWYEPKVETQDWVRARMSYDGEYMFIANGNVPSLGKGALVRVMMDGTHEKTYDVPDRHHDVLILPDETIVYTEYETTGQGICDRVMEMDPETGDAVEVFKIRDHFSQLASAGEWCHSNAVNYVPSEDAYYMSVLNQNMIIKWKRSSGELIWTFGGSTSDYNDVSWYAQHQFHVLPEGLLFFNNNNSNGFTPEPDRILSVAGSNPATGGLFGSSPSHALEWTVNEDSETASIVWDYSSGSLNSFSMGDAKRMPNGNTLITFSTQGTIQEVDSAKKLVREIKWLGATVGYANRLSSLYSVPPEYDFYPHR